MNKETIRQITRVLKELEPLSTRAERILFCIVIGYSVLGPIAYWALTKLGMLK